MCASLQNERTREIEIDSVGGGYIRIVCIAACARPRMEEDRYTIRRANERVGRLVVCARVQDGRFHKRSVVYRELDGDLPKRWTPLFPNSSSDLNNTKKPMNGENAEGR